MEKIVRYTKFPDNPRGDGGAKRSAQIKEYWLQRGVEFIDEKFLLPKQYSTWQAIKWVCRAFAFITCKVGWKHYCTIEDKYRALLTYALRLPVIYDKYKGKDITFLWENTNDVPSVFLMKATGAKIIGLPHNLESLVPTQRDNVTHKCAPYWLYEEIERYKMCDEVYCISKEETWLLQLFGVNAKYYPYYPPKEIEQELLAIKEKRATYKSKGKHYLLLGSATNPPTRMGMQNIIDCFEQLGDVNYTIHVAGFRTETLSVPADSKIVNHGTVSNEELERLLIQTDGLIIYQPTTSGALTRIAECRVAGIPVYANFGAARDYYNLPDVHVYANMEELKEILAN